MTNVGLLNEKINNSGLKRNFIAQQLNLTPQGLFLKTSGRTEFIASEIQRLCELLKITSQKEINAIFFAK